MTDAVTTEPMIIDLTNCEDTESIKEEDTTLKRKSTRTRKEDSQQENVTKKAKTDKTTDVKTEKEVAKIEKEREKEEEKQEKLEKKRKLDEEKEMKRKQIEREKELKKKKQEEEKLERERKKEAERIQKEKEKQEKERIRLEKKKKLEDEKKAKEMERQRIEEEKRKAEEAKERSQMKISSFFQVGQRLKLKTTTTLDTSSNISNKTVTKSAYDKEFLPFFVQNNVTLASTINNDISETKTELDNLIQTKETQPKQSFQEFLESFVKTTQTGKTSITPEEIINALNSSTTTEQQVYQMIESLPPIKYISFYENSKPPYIGTWCSLAHQRIQSDIIKNPLNTDLTGLDYEYDSDLEWNKEDDEGEDIGDDDEEEEEEEEVSSAMEDDDDVEFVENDFQNGTKKKKFITLTVINKWNNEENSQFFESFSTVKLIDIADPIDPFKNYWGYQQPSQEQPGSSNSGCTMTSNNEPNATKTGVLDTTGTASSPNILIAQKKTIKDDQVLADLIKFIEKHDEFTINTLVELSKKEFKEYTKALIKNTIQDIAVYNKKQSKWEIKQDKKDKYLVNV